MIVNNQQWQCLECTVCGECVELRRVIASCPEKLFLLKELQSADHAPCESWVRTHPNSTKAAAAANRTFYVRLRAELQKLGREEIAGEEDSEARTRPETAHVYPWPGQEGRGKENGRKEGRETPWRSGEVAGRPVNKCQAKAA